MNKNSKSRIPVSVLKQKSSKLYSDEKSVQPRSNFLKKQSSDANKTTRVSLMHKKTEKKISLQPEKSKNIKDSNVKNSYLKNKPALKTCMKLDNISTNNKTFERNMKMNDKNKWIKETFNTNNKDMLSFPAPEIKFSLTDEKKENLPSPISYSFEEEVCTPVRNLTDPKQECVSIQENVEFEANELYRKMILSNKEFSPSMRKLMPSLRLSSFQCERPSVYQKLRIPDDPLKEALKALENTCLSAKRIRKESKLTQSPHRDVFKTSIYTPRGDPNEEFLKRLENFKLKQLQKSVPKTTKKVTFNLNIQESTTQNICDIKCNPVMNSENRLRQINESEENTPKSPISEKIDKHKLSGVSAKQERNDPTKGTMKEDNKDSVINIDYKDCAYTKYRESKVVDHSDMTPKSDQKTIEFVNSFYKKTDTSLQTLKRISCKNSPDFITDSKNIEMNTNCLRTNNMQASEQKLTKQSAKIYTPKPISLFVKSKINQSYSPELLVNRKSVIMADLAPICTPLVLKSQAKNVIFSPETDEGPIPLKLDFTKEEKEDTPKKESRRSSLFPLDNIVTIQKQLDILADQECHLSLINETFPVICGRYLTNPLATILNEGDDMHFIPIRP